MAEDADLLLAAALAAKALKRAGEAKADAAEAADEARDAKREAHAAALDARAALGRALLSGPPGARGAPGARGDRGTAGERAVVDRIVERVVERVERRIETAPARPIPGPLGAPLPVLATTPPAPPIEAVRGDPVPRGLKGDPGENAPPLLPGRAVFERDPASGRTLRLVLTAQTGAQLIGTPEYTADGELAAADFVLQQQAA